MVIIAGGGVANWKVTDMVHIIDAILSRPRLMMQEPKIQVHANILMTVMLTVDSCVLHK